MSGTVNASKGFPKECVKLPIYLRDFLIASALFCFPPTDNTEIVLNVAIYLDFVEY